LKFSVENEELSSKMALASRSISTSGGNTALGGVLMTVEEGKLTFGATDGNRSIRIPVHLASPPEGEGRVLVPGKLFPEVARLLGSGSSQIEYRSSERDVAITSGGSSFHIKTMPAEDFPPLPDVGGDSISMPAEGLVESIDLVARAAARDDMRPVLTAVQVVVSGSNFNMVATDSYRLAVNETDLGSPSSLEIDRNVPADALRELTRVIATTGAESVKFGASDREVVFEVEGVVLTTTTVEGQFPKYQQIFPEEWTHEVRLPRDELLESVRRVGKMAIKNRPLKLTFSSGELTISASTPDLGDAEEKIPAAWGGDEMSIGFNAEFFREGIEGIAGGEILLKLISPLRPGLLQAVENEDFRYLIMPIRLED
jgi:DNA polymerase-3 subunit beta